MPVVDELTCGLCANPFHSPRIYDPCGHTYCSFCMMRHDYVSLERCHQSECYPQFSCPMCRAVTLRRWFERPLNLTVEAMVREHGGEAGYQERGLAIQGEFAEWRGNKDDHFGIVRSLEGISAPHRDLNLSAMARSARAAKAQELYALMFPVVATAASAGQCRVVFTTRAREMNSVVEGICALFNRHNVYSIRSTLSETVVNVTDDARGYARGYDLEHVNPLYDAGTGEGEWPPASPGSPGSPDAPGSPDSPGSPDAPDAPDERRAVFGDRPL
jgi:hypothetical protein